MCVRVCVCVCMCACVSGTYVACGASIHVGTCTKNRGTIMREGARQRGRERRERESESERKRDREKRQREKLIRSRV